MTAISGHKPSVPQQATRCNISPLSASRVCVTFKWRQTFAISSTLIFSVRTRSDATTTLQSVQWTAAAYSGGVATRITATFFVASDRSAPFAATLLGHMKGKERKSIYIALFWPRWYTQSAQAWITQFYLQITPRLPLLRERSPDVTTAATEAANYSRIDPQKDERLSWPSWLTYSGWLTNISGHPSATGRAQDSESTPAKDRRSTAGRRNQSVGICMRPHESRYIRSSVWLHSAQTDYVGLTKLNENSPAIAGRQLSNDDDDDDDRPSP